MDTRKKPVIIPVKIILTVVMLVTAIISGLVLSSYWLIKIHGVRVYSEFLVGTCVSTFYILGRKPVNPRGFILDMRVRVFAESVVRGLIAVLLITGLLVAVYGLAVWKT